MIRKMLRILNEPDSSPDTRFSRRCRRLPDRSPPRQPGANPTDRQGDESQDGHGHHGEQHGHHGQTMLAGQDRWTGRQSRKIHVTVLSFVAAPYGSVTSAFAADT